MITEKHPVLYSYRRCPYAMRARMTIYLSQIQVEQREIVFWDKPQAMLQASPKGTVPVLVLPDGAVIDESRDIMLWAFNNSTDKSIYQAWLFAKDTQEMMSINAWIDQCDNEFKPILDRYKYADRFPENLPSDYRELGCEFLQDVESSLKQISFEHQVVQYVLVGDRFSLADIAIFPFIRQFVNVDKNWFHNADYPRLKLWLQALLDSSFFKEIMKNRPVWQVGHKPLWLNEPSLTTRNEFTEKACF